jgi:hypothetical protein
MDHIKTVAGSIRLNPQSQTPSSAATITPIPTDKRRAMGEVIDRWRLNQGYNPYDNAAQELAIQSWCASLDAEGVPHTAYAELYQRAVTTRAMAIQSGKSLPNFGVELLLAGWIGEHGLRNELRQREYDARVKAGRTLGTSPDADAMDPKEGFEYLQSLLGQKSNVTQIR